MKRASAAAAALELPAAAAWARLIPAHLGPGATVSRLRRDRRCESRLREERFLILGLTYSLKVSIERIVVKGGVGFLLAN